MWTDLPVSGCREVAGSGGDGNENSVP